MKQIERKMIGVYFQSWSSKWVANYQDMDLTHLDPRINIVYLAFAQPQSTYSNYSWDGTGLDFSHDFATVQKAIDSLVARKVQVILSVGGSDYPWTNYTLNSIQLAKDLGCTGIDIDWEPSTGYQASSQLSEIINAFSGHGLTVSLAAWSTGAYPPMEGDMYSGMNITGIKEQGHNLNWINIMSYDAGSDYKPLCALSAYRSIFKGPLYLGGEIGTQSWGNALLSTQDIWTWAKAVKAENVKNGLFFWSLQSTALNTPTCMEAVGETYEAFK
jgi:GH18 family chitinase